jgi:hypothetical protein
VDYRIVYDIAAHGHQGGALLWLAASLLVAAALLFAWLRAAGRSCRPAWLAGIAAAAIAAFACVEAPWEHHGLRAALAEGRAMVAEGAVEDHQTQRVRFAEGGRRTLMWESFVLGGVRFGYYRDVSAPGFRNTGDAALALRDGLRLRVHYVRDRAAAEDALHIVRLEAADDAPPAREAALVEGGKGG